MGALITAVVLTIIFIVVVTINAMDDRDEDPKDNDFPNIEAGAGATS